MLLGRGLDRGLLGLGLDALLDIVDVGVLGGGLDLRLLGLGLHTLLDLVDLSVLGGRLDGLLGLGLGFDTLLCLVDVGVLHVGVGGRGHLFLLLLMVLGRLLRLLLWRRLLLLALEHLVGSGTLLGLLNLARRRRVGVLDVLERVSGHLDHGRHDYCARRRGPRGGQHW